MSMIDAKTNFMLLMSLMDIAPSEMAPAIGTDATLISRWRTGKRRLIAGRPWIKKVAVYFVEQDELRGVNCIEPIMSTLYPGRPCQTHEQRATCVTQFLLCPGQLELDYRRRRYDLLNRTLPGRLQPPKGPQEAANHVGEKSHGKQKLMGAVMEYLATVSESQQEPQRMILVAPEGLNPLLRIGGTFAKRLMERLQALFEKGHSMILIVRPDYQTEGTEQFRARVAAMHLRGYMETHYCDELSQPGKQQHDLIMTYRHAICVSVTIPGGDPELAQIHTVKSPATANKAYAMALKLRSRTPERHRQSYFDRPSDYLSALYPVGAVHEGGLYCLGDLPFFCTMSAYDAAKLYNLRDSERDTIERAYWPIFVEPGHVRGFMRHILCRDEIERALVSDEIAVPELSLMLGRHVTISRSDLIWILKRIEDMLQRCDHYEVAFLPRHVMEPMGLRAVMVEGVCAVGSGADGRSAATHHEHDLAHKYGEFVWRRIPSGMKSRPAAVRTVQTLIQTYEALENEA